MFGKFITKSFNCLMRKVNNNVPIYISSNFKKIDSSGSEKISRSLRNNYYFTRTIFDEAKINPETYLSTEEGKQDLLYYLEGRLSCFRQTVIPWLNDAKPLIGANILEIGCGTGSSTVALAEQGANVTAIDIDEGSLAVAKDMCKIYCLRADFIKANATAVDKLFLGRHFDFIIFFAALEHMNCTERIVAMKATWDMLSKNDLWCVIDTPNRLWYYDGHTSLLPFYHWLPDDLAFCYSRFSPRKIFCQAYHKWSPEAIVNLLRNGRGVSFHEFDIAIKKIGQLDVISNLSDFLRKRNLIGNLRWQLTFDHFYSFLLAKVGPKINRGFYEQYLNLIIKKD